jgi:hypothetical protein
VRLKDDATTDELRQEIMRRLGVLQEAGRSHGSAGAEGSNSELADPSFHTILNGELCQQVLPAPASIIAKSNL